MARTNSQTNAKSVGVAHRAIALLLLFILSSSVAFAHSVTMNFRFHITDINDINHTGATYVSSERDNTLVALVFAGGLLTQISLDKTNSPYLFNMVQDENQNRFLLALTNGTWQKIESKPAGKIPATTFGDLTLPAVITKGFVLQLQSDTLDLIGTLGPGQVLVRSLGRLRIPLVEANIG
jgi:hypothetical protein